MAKNANVIVISSDTFFCKRAQVLAETFSAHFEHYDSDDSYSEKVVQHDQPDFIIISASHAKTQADAAGFVQVAKFIAPKSTVIVVVSKKVSPDYAIFIKKSGAQLILLEEEFLKNSKIEFIYGQNAFGEYVPVKSSEFIEGKIIDFNVFHILPLNNKVLPVLRTGESFEAGKLAKMHQVGEFYIKREDVDQYSKWIELNIDRSSKGLKSRCRAQFLNMTVTYKSLVNLITDRSEMASFSKGKQLIEKCTELAKNLVTSLSDSGDAWDVVNLSAFADFSALDRAPAIAAYAGIASLLTSVGSPDQVMIAAMLADIGLLELSSEAARLLLNNGPEAISGTSEQTIYHQHPVLSLNSCLERKLPIPENLKEIILCTHERGDQKGFPVGKVVKIPLEAQLIRFCELLDRSTRVELGKGRINPAQIRQDLIKSEMTTAAHCFSPELLGKLKQL